MVHLHRVSTHASHGSHTTHASHAAHGSHVVHAAELGLEAEHLLVEVGLVHHHGVLLHAHLGVVALLHHAHAHRAAHHAHLSLFVEGSLDPAHREEVVSAHAHWALAHLVLLEVVLSHHPAVIGALHHCAKEGHLLHGVPKGYILAGTCSLGVS